MRFDHSKDGPNGCWSKDPRPDDAPRYTGPDGGHGKAGYVAGHRRARYDEPGRFVPRDEAARIEDFHEQMMDESYTSIFGYDD